MPENPEILIQSTFEEEVREGLTAYPKYLSSKYIYDERGDRLFQEIMAMPEYYLTDSEFEIFEADKDSMMALFEGDGSPFRFIELGAGDGHKTKVLLKAMVAGGLDFTYVPIDISANVLRQLRVSLASDIPQLDVMPMQGTYMEVLDQLDTISGTRNILLFLGSNIGNLLHGQAIDFLKGIHALMGTGDLLLVGFDLKKNPQTILDAYNDANGITEAFNKNLLHRINRELEGDFDPDRFLHWETYDPESGTAKSYLVAKEEQHVTIGKLNLKIFFRAWETIHTEISQKYDQPTISWLAEESGLEIRQVFSDSRRRFANYVFGKG